MQKTVRGKFTGGSIEPLEKLDLREGDHITITVSLSPTPDETLGALRSTAGTWKGTQDHNRLKRNIYSDRLVSTRAVSCIHFNLTLLTNNIRHYESFQDLKLFR